jgi:ribulose-phosphate 3-epimerase
MHIHPAILVDNLSDLLIQIADLTPAVREIDIDIIDWQRTAKKTLSYYDALSAKTKMTLDFDLMLNKPRSAVEALVRDPRVRNIILNPESQDDIGGLIDLIHHYHKIAGLAINPDTAVYQISPYLKTLELIEIYTIEPGAQGMPFLPHRLELCHEVKQLGFTGLIEVDGGFNKTTWPIFKNYPIDIVSVGSAISKDQFPLAAYQSLVELIKEV